MRLSTASRGVRSLSTQAGRDGIALHRSSTLNTCAARARRLDRELRQQLLECFMQPLIEAVPQRSVDGVSASYRTSSRRSA